MLEKLLTPFTSEGTKLVLAAMEKHGDEETASYEYARAVEKMYELARGIAPRIDHLVLTKARRRIQKKITRREDMVTVQTIAGKILMGDKFIYDPTPPPANTFFAAMEKHTAQQQAMQQQAMQQQAMQQYANQAGMLTSVHPFGSPGCK